MLTTTLDGCQRNVDIFLFRSHLKKRFKRKRTHSRNHFENLIWFHRYYRANSVRYQTSPCEGVCALNHYCAITRVDYHEFRHCLESAASALASSSARPNVCIPIVANIALLVATYIIMKCQQRQLLFELLQFLVVDIVIVIALLFVQCMRNGIVTFMHCMLSLQWINNYVSSLQTKLSLRYQNHYADNINIDDYQSFIVNGHIQITTAITTTTNNNDDRQQHPQHHLKHLTNETTYDRILSIVENFVSGEPIHSTTTQTVQQPSYELFCSNRKLCQNKLNTFLDSFKQIYKLNDFTVRVVNFVSQKITNYSV